MLRVALVFLTLALTALVLGYCLLEEAPAGLAKRLYFVLNLLFIFTAMLRAMRNYPPGRYF